MRPKVPPPLLLMLPLSVITLLFLAGPSFLSLGYSFFKFQGPNLVGFNGLGNYALAFSDARFLTALGNMGVYLALIVPVEVFVPLMLALALNNVTKGHKAFRAILVIPIFTSTISASFIWLFFFSSFGPLGPLYTMLGMPNGVLSTPGAAIFGVSFIPIWMGIGFYALLYSVGLNSINRNVVEATKIDGASPWGTFRYVTLPLLKPTFAFVATMAIIWNAQIFDPVYLLTRGGPGTLTYSISYYIYSSAFNYLNFSETYVMSAVLLVIVMTLAYISITRLGFGRPSWM